uniref:Uncharacterized protein n=1 Tax=Knipowitschia caucasica TaxID=637954 RepID=A0AAV2MML9_KNICA
MYNMNRHVCPNSHTAAGYSFSTILSKRLKKRKVFSSDSSCLLCSLSDSAWRKSKILWLSVLFLFLGVGVLWREDEEDGVGKREDCLRMELEKQTGSMVQRRQSPTEYPHWGSRQD